MTVFLFPVASLMFCLIFSLGMVVYHAIETRKVDKAMWKKKHPLMPYAGPDIGYFIGLYGVFIPMIFVMIACYFLF